MSEITGTNWLTVERGKDYHSCCADMLSCTPTKSCSVSFWLNMEGNHIRILEIIQLETVELSHCFVTVTHLHNRNLAVDLSSRTRSAFLTHFCAHIRAVWALLLTNKLSHFRTGDSGWSIAHAAPKWQSGIIYVPIILYRGILFNGSIWVYGAYSVSFICDTLSKIFLSFIMVSIIFMIQKSFYFFVPLDLCATRSESSQLHIHTPTSTKEIFSYKHSIPESSMPVCCAWWIVKVHVFALWEESFYRIN